MASFAGGDVWRIDPDERKRCFGFRPGAAPRSVAVAGGQRARRERPHSTVSPLIDAESRRELGPSRRAAGRHALAPRDVASARRRLWFADPTRHVGRPPRSRTYRAAARNQAIPVPPDDTSLADAYESFDGFACRPGLPLGRRGRRRSARSGASTRGRDASSPRSRCRSFRPISPSGAGAVWVTSLLGDTVVRIDPDTQPDRRDGARRAAERAASPSGFGSLWVANSIDGTVSRIDPEDERVVATIPVGHEPGDIAVGPTASG